MVLHTPTLDSELPSSLYPASLSGLSFPISEFMADSAVMGRKWVPCWWNEGWGPGIGRAGLADRLVTRLLLSPQGPKDAMSPPNLIAWSDQPPSPYTPLLEDSLGGGQPASATA